MKILLRTEGLRARIMTRCAHEGLMFVLGFSAVLVWCRVLHIQTSPYNALRLTSIMQTSCWLFTWLLSRVWKTRWWRKRTNDPIHTVAISRRQRNCAQMGRELQQLTRAQRNGLNERVVTAMDREIERVTLIK